MRSSRVHVQRIFSKDFALGTEAKEEIFYHKKALQESYEGHQNTSFGKIIEKKSLFKSLLLWLPGSSDELAGNVVIKLAKLEKFMERDF